MTDDLTFRLKLLLPGYTAKWRRRARVFLSCLDTVFRDFDFGWEGNEPVAVRKDGLLKIHGTVSPKKELRLYALLRDALPEGFDPQHFRLARDLVTRYLFPHLRPDLYPGGDENLDAEAAELVGFHGQHKDTIMQVADPALRRILLDAFTPKPNDMILDCGAFMGIGEVAVAPLLTQGRMIALEADQRWHRMLAKNVDASGLTNVRHRNAAIWNVHGATMQLATGDAQANTLKHDVYDGGGRQEVETVSVDGILNDESMDELTMLSLTVNGAEVEALEGARETLHERRPRIRLAGWYERDGRKVSDLCVPALESAGYRVYVGPRHGVLALPEEAFS